MLNSRTLNLVMLLTWWCRSSDGYIIIMNIPSNYHQALLICGENEGNWQTSLKQGKNSGSVSNVHLGSMDQIIYMSVPQSYRSGGWFFKNPWSSKMFAKIQGSHSLAFLEVICILQSCIFKCCLRISSFCKTEKVLKSQFDCLVL